MIFFIHNPKTAGTSMVDVLQKQIYFDQFLRLNPTKNTHPKDFLKNANQLLRDKFNPKLKVIGGHFAHGIHKGISNNAEYFTVLRNPINRVISEYYYMKQKGFYYQDLIIRENLSLIDYLDHPKTHYLNNLQTRLISGISYESGDLVTEKEYDIALENLQKMKSVGISERFSETLALFFISLNWKRLPISIKSNANNERPEFKSINKSVIEKIKQREKYDLELYDKASTLFANNLTEHKNIILELVRKIENPSLYHKQLLKLMNFQHKIKKKLPY